MMKKILSLLIIAGFSFVVLPSAYTQADLPKILPPSPEVAALFRYQDYPMDYSTGLPQISIPIYEVKSGSLSVPISLSYHASGRRASDQDGPVALGWSLNAGGIISRTVYGSVDFGSTKGTYNFAGNLTDASINSLTNHDNLQYFEKIMHYGDPTGYPEAWNAINPWAESEYDIFSYNFGNNSGKFIFQDNNDSKTPVLLPIKPYKITPYYTTSATTGLKTGLSGIDIIDDKGTLYSFSQAETSDFGDDNPTTSFLITQIISADKSDTISFQYTGFPQWNFGVNQQLTYIDQYTAQTGQTQLGNTAFSDNAVKGFYTVMRLTEIDFKLGKVVFSLVDQKDKIDSILIKDVNDKKIKTIKFNRSILDVLTEGGTTIGAPLANQVNNKLDLLEFKDATGATQETYSFEYYPTVYGNSTTTVDQHYVDWWGYYNASGIMNMIPRYTIGSIQVGDPTYNRTPNLEALKSGMLKKITFPTGGNTSFIYENNKYGDASNSSGLLGPGLRVSQIISDDSRGNGTIRTFTYGLNECGYGALDLKPSLNTMASHMDYYSYNYPNFQPLESWNKGEYTFTSGFNSALGALASRPVVYTQVTEYTGTPANNVGKTVYDYDYYSWAPAGMQINNNQLIAKMHISDWNYWNMPSLLAKTDYKSTPAANGTSQYTPRKKVINAYNVLTTSSITGLHVQRLKTFPQNGTINDATHAYLEQFIINTISPTPDIYTFGAYHIPVGSKNLSSTSETLYNDDGTTTSNTTSYTYNTKQYPSQTTRTKSDLSTITTDIKYPFDYTGNSTLTGMINLNMLNYPIEQIEAENGTHLKSVRTNYANWSSTSNPMYLPQTVDTRQGTDAYETRLRYYSYDGDGNPTSVSKENDVLHSYLWGYRNSYPLAEVLNAKSNEIFFNSFEEGGAWDNNLTAYDNAKSHSGFLSGRIDKSTAGEQVSFSTKWLAVNFTAATKFKYSGWVYSNGPSAQIFLYMKRAGETGSYTYTDQVTTTVTSKWVYIEKEFTVPADVTQMTLRIDNNGGGTVWFDDLRLHPSAAKMSSFTYGLLRGIKSQTDMNNYNTYYEYDDYGRLNLIKDFNGNILKTFNYQYQSSTP